MALKPETAAIAYCSLVGAEAGNPIVAANLNAIAGVRKLIANRQKTFITPHRGVNE